MRSRWRIFLPIGLVTLVGALGLYRLGERRADLTETEVIAAFAARYLEDAGAGAEVTDCLARPAQGGRVWLVVICDGPAGRFRYPVTPLGTLAPDRASPPEA